MSEQNIIEKRNGPDDGTYFIVIDAEQAEMTYTRRGDDRVSIDHTFVPDSMRGRGIAQALASFAIEDARKSGWKIEPRCSFMEAQFRRHPEWQDVLAK